MRHRRSPESEPQSRIVPMYALTAGRTRSVGRDLPLESMVTITTQGMVAVTSLQFEPREIALLCRQPQSIAEVAAKVRVPLGVARVLVSDLAAAGVLSLHVPTGGVAADRAILERLLNGLRAK